MVLLDMMMIFIFVDIIICSICVEWLHYNMVTYFFFAYLTDVVRHDCVKGHGPSRWCDNSINRDMS